MKVRAKFVVQGITPESEGSTIILHPVVGGSPENDSFFKYTPAGCISLSTVNESAVEQFEPGKEFYVDFTPVE